MSIEENPLQLAYSCSICGRTASELYNNVDQNEGMHDGLGPNERSFLMLWLTDCGHLICRHEVLSHFPRRLLTQSTNTDHCSFRISSSTSFATTRALDLRLAQNALGTVCQRSKSTYIGSGISKRVASIPAYQQATS